MRTFAKFTLAPLLAAGLLSVPALAADQNTYRSGSPYLKTVAHSYQQCEQQCRGDAACRGWNFVRPNAGSMSGVCEFNARNAAPTASPISMSGIISTSVDPLMSRAVPSGTNTIRVGNPSAPQAGAVISRRGKTIVKRMPVPQKQRAMRPTAHTRPTAPAQNPAAQGQDPRKPRVYGSLNAPKMAPKAAPKPTPSAVQTAPQRNLTREQAYYREQYLAHKRQQQHMQAQQRQAQKRQVQQKQTAMMQRPNTPQRQAPAMPMQQRRAPRPPQGLYGNLHDDLTKSMTIVPRPQTAPDNLTNPDAPMATSRAVPSKPVHTAPLSKPALPALAGG